RCLVAGGSTNCDFTNTGQSICPKPSAPTSTGSPTTTPLRARDLLAWKAIYDALDGKNWSKCAANGGVSDPCVNCASIVQCFIPSGTSELVLRSINLSKNNLAGFVPVTAINSRREYLNLLDLSENPKLVGLGECLDFQFCYGAGVTCNVRHSPISLC